MKIPITEQSELELTFDADKSFTVVVRHTQPANRNPSVVGSFYVHFHVHSGRGNSGISGIRA
jgi:hypothetical protein